MMIQEQSITPDKSVIETIITKNSTSQRVRFINKQGFFTYSPTCAGCRFIGRVQSAFGYYIEPTCDRDMLSSGKWRKMSAMYPKTRKKCKFFKESEFREKEVKVNGAAETTDS